VPHHTIACIAQRVPAAAREPMCRLCGSRLHRVVLDLGCQPLANRLIQPGVQAVRYPLRTRVCDSCLLVQTDDTAPPAPDGHRLLPHAARSTLCLDHDRRFALTMCQRLGLASGSLVIEVGARDPVLVRQFHEAGVPVLAIEPGPRAADAALALGVPTDIGRFNAETAMEIAVRHGRADLVVVWGGMPAVANLFDFVAGFAGVLRPKGIVVFQFPHLLPIIQKAQFDAFRHDRLNYLSLLAMERVLHPAGLRVFDAERLTDQGGSLRVYACHTRGPHAARPGLKAVRLAEAESGLDRPEGYDSVQAAVTAAREEVREFLAVRRAAGRTVGAYGAVARGNMLLNVCGTAGDHIAWVADPDPDLTGLHLPGSQIPIVPIQTMMQQRPDDLLILPWPNAAELAASLSVLRQKGTLFWTATPAIRRV
jgi:hypothetical protein